MTMGFWEVWVFIPSEAGSLEALSTQVCIKGRRELDLRLAKWRRLGGGGEGRVRPKLCHLGDIGFV